ncbi:hypothetical protein JHK87_009561 [Glycine soja]|nr:hypothetical protein JHK87_009561 [Glycine soja]
MEDKKFQDRTWLHLQGSSISFSAKGFLIRADLKGGLAFFVILKSFSTLAFENITFENFAPEMDDHDEIDILASSIVGEMLPPRFVGHKNQSTAWDHLDKLPDPNPLSQAKSHCGALIKYSSGTTSMCTHLDKCKKNSDVMSKRQKSDSSSTTITLSSYFMIDQEACWIALDELTCKLRDKVKSSLRSLFEEYSNGGDEFEVSSQEARAQPSERVENDPYGYSQYFQ